MEPYVAQLKAEFDDSASGGFLGEDGLTRLCHRLHLQRHLPALVVLLLGPGREERVNFEEFKDGFVAVLSQDPSSSEESSYLEPVVPEEVKPKFVKGSKRYGRRSRPDSRPDSDQDQDQDQDQGPKLRRTTSLESIESLQSDEAPVVSSRGAQQLEASGVMEGPLSSEQVQWMLRRLDAGVDGRVSLSEVLRVLCSPVCSSTPARTTQVQRGVSSEERSFHCASPSPLSPPPLSPPGRQAEECSFRHTASSLLTGARERSFGGTSSSLLTGAGERSFRGTSSSLQMVGQRLLSALDDGTGTVNPQEVLSLWREEGLQDPEEVLQVLDFALEDRVSLSELSLALDNELQVSASGVHQAALICYRSEVQHLQAVLEQACRQRDKLRTDLDQADVRNLQLIREVDDRQNSLETSANNRIRDVESEYRERLSSLRTEMEAETEAAIQQLDREKTRLTEQLTELTTRHTELQEELQAARKENVLLEAELSDLKVELRESEASLNKLHRDLDQILLEKCDSSGAALNHDERFTEIIREYELQCRELRDRNDELSSELESVKSHKPEIRKTRPGLSWNQDRTHRNQDRDQDQTSDYDESEARDASPLPRRRLAPQDKTALCSLDSGADLEVDSGFSIQTELALEQLRLRHQADSDKLRTQHEEEVHQLNIHLETQVNFYERTLEQMRRSMELERKDICQAFKLEICELEEQKADLEQQLKTMKENMEKTSLRQTELRTHDQEKRLQRERADMEQNFAREISNLVQRLSSEKDQLEAELRLKMDQELLLMRTQMEEVRSENSAVQERLSLLQQEVQTLEQEVDRKRRKIEEMERNRGRLREEEERLHKENAGLREQVLDLSARNLDLSNANADLSAKMRSTQEEVLMVKERLSTLSHEEEEERKEVQKLKEQLLQMEREKQQKSSSWSHERLLLQTELSSARTKVSKLQELEAELKSVNLKLQFTETDQLRLRQTNESRDTQVEQLKASMQTLEMEAESLRAQLQSTNQEAQSHKQEVTQTLQRLQHAQHKVEELESSFRKLMVEKEEVTSAMEAELQQLRKKNQELENKVQEVVVERQQMQRLTQDQAGLRSELDRLQSSRDRAEDQALRADTELSLVRAQHLRQIHTLQNQNQFKAGSGSTEELQTLKNLLQEEREKRQELEQVLNQDQDQVYSLRQEQLEQTVSLLQQKSDDLETQLKSTRLLLHEKNQEIREQMQVESRSSSLLKRLFEENSELQGALQETEQRHRQAQSKSHALQTRVQVLTRVLKGIVPHAIA